MKMNLKHALSLTVIISLMGCQQVGTEDVNTSPAATTNDTKVIMSQEEQAIVGKMQWVENADAIADANQSLKESAKTTDGKPELIAFAGRGMSYPGLTHSQYEEIKNKVTSRTAMGSGDVIYGDTQKTLRKKLQTYASDYNMVIYKSLVK